MVVKVIIERYIKEDAEKEVLQLLRELRTRALFREGYVSGETLRSIHDPSLFTVISTWHTAAEWEAWANDSERTAIEGELESHLKSKPRVTL